MSRTKHERNQEIIKLKNAGVTFADIGRQLGISRQMAQKIHKRLVERLSLNKTN